MGSTSRVYGGLRPTKFGTQTRLSLATELIIFRPTTEVRRLALLVESIVADWILNAAEPIVAL